MSDTAHPRRGATHILAIAGLGVGLLLLVLWSSGALAGIEAWAADRQREAQTLMAGALRQLRAGQPGATGTLLAICFGYGLVHAVGPGHGKILIGGYGYGTQVPMGRLAMLALLSSLAQAGTAVALVWGGIALLDLSREALTGLTEDSMADISALMIALVGLWLAFRGARLILRTAQGGQHHDLHMHDHEHGHDHQHAADCGCRHAHGPTAEEVMATRSLRDAVMLIAGIAARPCTGALFLLILTWRMDVFTIGVAGAMAMGLGTASVTLLVAAMSVWARRGSLALLPASGPLAALGRWLPGAMQLAAGCLIAVAAIALVL
ncbi:hypothetical protein MU516_11580 [Paracoccus sp. YLB-12]|uniref:Nickel/cobalt efflux system n=1 Tax=Paracoccus maritimus TaxID=2933292 RepID=A0ABT2KAF9_9RHOB|nr:hypothetical protein [Paracoccus sp. YLB-12]MCT4333504.1 hypothetical protein [Paracoccus sp. YLB-12]